MSYRGKLEALFTQGRLSDYLTRSNFRSVPEQTVSRYKVEGLKRLIIWFGRLSERTVQGLYLGAVLFPAFEQ
jgi:hypothetical protein